jgi:tRNA(adenine34) deaminase
VNNVEHNKFMKEALRLAKISASLGEVPVGAVVVFEGEIVGLGLNRRELTGSCVEHAEMNAVKDASVNLGRWRLIDTTVYSTLEPCIMCTGALCHARISCLVYGVLDPKFGAIESLYSIACDTRLNHQFVTISGVMAEECSKLLKDFFYKLRHRN